MIYPPGSFITVGGTRYELQQFHFHKPSEEAIDGRHADMVAHLVHKDDQGRLAVVAVLLNAGQINPMVATLWNNLPARKETEVEVPGVRINAADLLPADHAYYSFAGSLTTPPCSEGVSWFVLKISSTLSSGEIGRFGRSYPMNARPTQPLNGRMVRVSDEARGRPRASPQERALARATGVATSCLRIASTPTAATRQARPAPIRAGS